MDGGVEIKQGRSCEAQSQTKQKVQIKWVEFLAQSSRLSGPNMANYVSTNYSNSLSDSSADRIVASRLLGSMKFVRGV